MVREKKTVHKIQMIKETSQAPKFRIDFHFLIYYL